MPVTAVRSFWASGNLHFVGNGSTDAAVAGGHINYSIVDSGAVLHGAGTSTTRVTTSTADKKFLSYYVENSATSGDNRGMYLRQYLSGAGSGGEAARIFSTVADVACGTVHGAHISTNFASTGSITGLGVGVRSTLHIPDAALTGGSYYGAQSEIYADGASSDISGATNHACHRFLADGNATGSDTVQVLWAVDGFKTGTAATDVVKSTAPGTVDGALRIEIDGTAYWIPTASAAS